MNDSLTIDISGLTPDQVMQVLTSLQTIRNGNSSRQDEVDESWRTAVSTGWTHAHLDTLREKLSARGKNTQLAAFDAAIKNGGFISRNDVFTIGEYAQDRKLNNWTAPFRNIATELVDEHGLPEGASLPMWADYIQGSGYRQTRGFLVAPEIVRLVNEPVDSSLDA